MREIKFRAFEKSSNTMFSIKSIYFDTHVARANSLKFYRLDDIELMQYTDLKDRNGVEIYEGDIVRHSRVASDISIVRFGEFGVPNVEEMEYQDSAVGFYYENASSLKDVTPFNMTIPLNTEYANRDEIIGNIYETPELLEKE